MNIQLQLEMECSGVGWGRGLAGDSSRCVLCRLWYQVRLKLTSIHAADLIKSLAFGLSPEGERALPSSCASLSGYLFEGLVEV